MSGERNGIGEDGSIAGNESMRELHTLVLEEMQKMMQKLQKLWDEVGFNSNERNSRMADLREHVRHYCADQEKYKNDLLKQVNEKGKELFSLSKELEMYSEDLFEDGNQTLLEMDEHLSSGLRKMRAELEKRRHQLKELHLEEQELCEQLIEDPTPHNSRAVPSSSEVTDLQRRINTLLQEKKHRKRTFRSLKAKISELVKELHQSSNNSFTNLIINGEEELFTLSLTNLDAMKRLKADLADKVLANEAELGRVRGCVERLWERLQVPLQEIDSVVAKVIDDDVPHNLAIYQQELQRLDELKKANMSKMIKSLKIDLELWWDNCYVADQDRHLQQSEDDESEEVLQELEEKVSSLQQLHSSARELYAGLDNWKKLWSKLIDLNQRHNDPARLFKNRGGALLQEESERNRVKGELPRVESDLQEKVQQWEKQREESGLQPSVFSVMGVPLHEYIYQQWQQHTTNKMSQAKERQNARAAQLEREVRFGAQPAAGRRRLNNTAALRTMASTTASSTRSALNQYSPLKKINRRVVLAERNPNKGSKATVVEAAVMQRRSARNRTRQENTSGNSTAQISTYSQFSANIATRSEKDHVRSSVMQSPHTTGATTARHKNKTALLVCRSPYNTVTAITTRTNPRPIITKPTTLPRVALLPPTRSSPYNKTNTTAAAMAGGITPRNRTGIITTPRTGATAARNVFQLNRSNATGSLLFRTPASFAYKQKHGSPGRSVLVAIPMTLPRRRSARIVVPLTGGRPVGSASSKAMSKLTTPAKNKLKFLI